MDQRCDELSKISDPPLCISRTLLLNIYKRHNIIRRKASYKFNRRLRTEYTETVERVSFCKDLLEYIHTGKQIIYMDETSTHLWEKMQSFRMPKEDPINVRLNKTRGKSVTIFGGISTEFKKAEFMLAEKTTIVNFKRYLE